MRFWPQDEHPSMDAIELLKHVFVLSKSEGPQKWLEPAVQMCTELLLQLMSVSLTRNLTGKLK
jgi:hypothetical protein